MKVALIAWPVCLLALSFSSYAKLVYNTQSSYKIHILKEGETLSGLLQKENHNPLYGKDRWVEKVLEANHLTLAQAKSLKKGMPVILPATAFEKDAVGLRQAAIIKHGLVGNRISKHQKATLGFQYHINNLQTSETSLSSAENYGLFLGYEDENHRVWRGLLFRPELEAGVLTHGTNRSQRREVVSYGPSFKLDTRISFRAPSSSASFGPTLGWESSSRALSSDEQLEVRRDHLLWSGVFVSKH
ncbi:MAG: hypothetical protein WD025_04955 [Bacteriovoracaceae bacterium]